MRVTTLTPTARDVLEDPAGVSSAPDLSWLKSIIGMED
jgi:hypothetical protein